MVLATCRVRRGVRGIALAAVLMIRMMTMRCAALLLLATLRPCGAAECAPEVALHKPFDGSHPSLLGTYLASCVVFASITQKTPIGIKYNYFDEISDSDKIFLQKIAHSTVEEFFNIKL